MRDARAWTNPGAVVRAGAAGRGFTLIELLVVVAIISLLVSILLPSLSKAKEAAKAAACSSNLRQFGVGIHFFAEDHNEWVPPLYDAALVDYRFPYQEVPVEYRGQWVDYLSMYVPRQLSTCPTHVGPCAYNWIASVGYNCYVGNYRQDAAHRLGDFYRPPETALIGDAEGPIGVGGIYISYAPGNSPYNSDMLFYRHFDFVTCNILMAGGNVSGVEDIPTVEEDVLFWKGLAE